MKHITLRLAMILGALVIVFLSIGRFFDNRCEGVSCIEQTFNSSVAKNGGNFSFHFGDHDDPARIDHEDIDETIDGKGAEVDAELPPTEDVDSIEIRSVSTEWIVRTVPGKLAVRFHEVRLKKWTISKDGKKLVIDVKPSGAQSADLDLPEAFKGSLRIGTISGTIDLGDKIALSQLILNTASGDVTVHSWPSTKLEINTVSGEVRTPEGIRGASPKDIVLQSVSGNFDVNFPSAFESLSAHTVSGGVRLKIPKTLEYVYDLHSVSGDFEGMPKGGTVNEGFGNKEMKGSTGNSVKAKIAFDSVSGDFDLNAGDAVGSR